MHSSLKTCPNEINDTKLGDLTSASSLKSSLASILRSSLTQSRLFNTGIFSEIKNEELSLEYDYEDTDEECNKNTIGNFQKNYLEFGQWPEIRHSLMQRFKAKFWNLRRKVNKNKEEKVVLQGKLRKIRCRREVGCGNCKVLKDKCNKTKKALEEAVELSSILLREVRNMEKKREMSEVWE